MSTEIITTTSAFMAMNTEIEVVIYSQVKSDKSDLLKIERQRAEAAVTQVRLLFNSVEASLSRFRPESELSRLNRQGHIAQASPLLYYAVSQALEMAEFTGGIFDPTILSALEAAGYGESFELIRNGQLVTSNRFIRSFSSYREVQLDPATRSITLPPNTRLDLGGIAKGMTVDKAGQLLVGLGFNHFMVNAGGDMYLSGQPLGQAETWSVDVLDPFALTENLTELTVRDSAIATSAVTRRRWRMGNKVCHHLINPGTGEPVNNGLASVTVIAPATQLADVLAKTALILGLEEGKTFIEKQAGCSALFITMEGQLVRTVDLPERSACLV